MKKAYKVYTEAIRNHFRVFYANWPIGEPVKLGDYGIMSGKIFIREGNIVNDYNLQFQPRIDLSRDNYYFKSTGSVKVEFFPKGTYIQPGMPRISASMKIDFANDEAVFFNAAGIKNHSIESSAKLGETILSMFNEGKWSEKKVIITRLVQADSTTIIISGKTNASISLDAKGVAIPNIDLADASIKLAVSVDDGIGFKIITEDGYFPMIGISGIKAKRWYKPMGNDEFVPMAKLVYANVDYIKGEISNNKTTYDEEFYFGDI